MFLFHFCPYTLLFSPSAHLTLAHFRDIWLQSLYALSFPMLTFLAEVFHSLKD